MSESAQLGGIALGVLLALLGLAAWFRAQQMWREAGLPAGNVVASDMGDWHPNNVLMIADDVRLQGRPDYLVRDHDGGLVPVEVKSGRSPAEPYLSHILQLAAYCFLVERHYGQRPSHGILQYRDRAFAIDYTADLENDLLDLLTEMHRDLLARNVARDHNDIRRCNACGVREYCDERLIPAEAVA